MLSLPHLNFNTHIFAVYKVSGDESELFEGESKITFGSVKT